MGRDRYRHRAGGAGFFSEWRKAISADAQRVKRDWPIFAWRNEKELKRQEDFNAHVDYYDGNAELAKKHLGRHLPEDKLPAEEIESYFAFELAGRSVTEWMRICDECDELQVTIAFAMMRCAMYIADEKD